MQALVRFVNWNRTMEYVKNICCSSNPLPCLTPTIFSFGSDSHSREDWCFDCKLSKQLAQVGICSLKFATIKSKLPIKFARIWMGVRGDNPHIYSWNEKRRAVDNIMTHHLLIIWLDLRTHSLLTKHNIMRGYIAIIVRVYQVNSGSCCHICITAPPGVHNYVHDYLSILNYACEISGFNFMHCSHH